MRNDQAPRKLAAFLAADIAGYSALMSADEEATVRDLKGHQRVVLPMISQFGGHVIDTAGDGILAEFPSVLNAVTCAIAIQKTMAERNATAEPSRRMQFRIGINQGDVVFDEARVYGDGVNVAARLQAIAEAGGICISNKVFDEVQDRIKFGCTDLGPQRLKNIPYPVRVYRLELNGDARAVAIPLAGLPPRSLPERPSIAVLPFANLSGDPEQDYFADGIVEDIITALSRLRWLFVIARNSSDSYKNRAANLKQIGRELGVRYLNEGSIRKVGSRVRITSQLVDTENGAHLWADKFDRELTDIFAIQDEVTASIVGVLAPEVTAAEMARVQQSRPSSVNAWDAYLRALPLMRQHTKPCYQQAVELLKTAVALSPDFAAAYARLSACSTQAAYHGWEGPSARSVSQALQLARHSIALDAAEPLAYDALASAHQFCNDWDKAEAAARRAIALFPACTAAYGTLINVLAFQGRTDEALEFYAQSEKTSPRDIDRSARLIGLAFALFVAGRYEETIPAVEQYVALRPSWYGGHLLLAATLGLTGRLAEASKAKDRVLQLLPQYNLRAARNGPLFRRPQDQDRIFAGLRKAGMPE